jgi:outer membrane protein|tara:strand:+ start:14934 stop:15437 length:504 start_codon:yes stop_codon:yes gene_type:complete
MKQHYTILAILISLSSFGQRLAYVDTHKILNAIPEYQQSQLEINRLSKNWENEIARIFQMANELSVALEAEKVLLTPDMIKDRGVTIKSMNDSARAKQMRYFGSTGSLFSKREEMVAPLQALIAGAIKEIARKKKLDFVFDKGSSVSVVYANESNDITSDVLRQLGY